jgi:hypothetical protein
MATKKTYQSKKIVTKETQAIKNHVGPEEFEEDLSMNIRMKEQPLNQSIKNIKKKSD